MSPWKAWRDVLLVFLKSEEVQAKIKYYRSVLEGDSTNLHDLGKAREGLAIFRWIETKLEKGE